MRKAFLTNNVAADADAASDEADEPNLLTSGSEDSDEEELNPDDFSEEVRQLLTC